MDATSFFLALARLQTLTALDAAVAGLVLSHADRRRLNTDPVRYFESCGQGRREEIFRLIDPTRCDVTTSGPMHARMRDVADRIAELRGPAACPTLAGLALAAE